MKILQINKFLYPKGGAETHMLSLIRLLEKNGHDVVCFSQKNPLNLDRPESKYFLNELDLGRISWASLMRWPRIFWSFKASYLIKQLILAEQPDIVHIHNIYHQLSPSILKTIKKLRVPIIMTVHDFKLVTPEYTLRADGKKNPHKNSRLIQAILELEFKFHRWLKIYNKNIDLFIVPSRFVKDRLISAGYPAKKIKLLPHCLADDFIIPSKKSKLSKEKYLFAYGRLDESKGFDDLIKVFQALRIAGLKVKIAGKGPEEKNLKHLVEQLGLTNQVEFLGQKKPKEIITLIQQAQAVINPSRVHETFGLTVLEAMALGCPVIASKTGGIPELIDSGVNGLLYEPGDIGGLKDQIEKLLSNVSLHKKISQAASAAAQKYSDQKAYLKKITSIYRTAIKNYKPPLRRINPFILNVILIGAIFLLLSWPFYQLGISQSRALIINGHTYPKTANLYWRNPITPETAQELAKWDLLALDMTAQTYSAQAIKSIRSLNPQIIILAYTSANEMPTSRLQDVEPQGYGQWHDLAAGDDKNWHLKTWQGSEISFWPGNIMMNLGVKNPAGQTYSDYLTDYYAKLLASGLWDGLLFDNTWAEACWLNQDIDIDADAQKDDCAKINTLWHQYYSDFFGQLRKKIGPDYLIIGNGNGDYSKDLNGRMFEGFPEYWDGGWIKQIEALNQLSSSGFKPRLNIINSDSNNTGNKYDFSNMRFGLMSALLFDAYYSFDYGPNLREHLWWYDEYEANLGQPLKMAINLLDQTNTKIVQSVWQREFENGIVLVNSSDRPQKISFEAEYEKLKGLQDQTINNGTIINQITLPANDGIILLKTLNKIQGALFNNGSFARVFNASGQVLRNGFFTYDNKFQGGNKIMYADLDGDGNQESFSTDKNSLTIYKTGSESKIIYPYGQDFNGGINLALVRIKNQEKIIMISPEKNGSNLIKFFDANLQPTGHSFTAYSNQWKNLGANIAACDLDNDGIDELVIGAGFGGGPHLKIFNQNGELLKEWFAYKSNFRGGVNVACGRIDDNQENKIVTGTGLTGGPHVKVFNQNGELLKEWFAYGLNKRDGVKVSLSDLDNNGLKEIIALTENFLSK